MANFQIIQIAPTPKEQESWLPKTTIFASLYETLNSICNIEGEEDSTHELARERERERDRCKVADPHGKCFFF